MSLIQLSTLNMSLLQPFHSSVLSAKVRRLYDIANVLTTLELIRKKTFLAPNHRKMPGYVWCGPSMAVIDTVCKTGPQNPLYITGRSTLYSVYDISP